MALPAILQEPLIFQRSRVAYSIFQGINYLHKNVLICIIFEGGSQDSQIKYTSEEHDLCRAQHLC